MATLLSLPPELLEEIETYLYVPDIGNFANSQLPIACYCLERSIAHESFLAHADRRNWKYLAPNPEDPVYRPSYRIRIDEMKDFLVALIETPALSQYIEDMS